MPMKVQKIAGAPAQEVSSSSSGGPSSIDDPASKDNPVLAAIAALSLKMKRMVVKEDLVVLKD